MATPLTSGAFDIPKTYLGRIEERVKSQSVLASLSPERPSLYGNVDAVRMTRKPRAQIVAEGTKKGSDTAEWNTVTASPIKFQTTVRMNDEVRWADEDHKLQITQDLIEGLADSAARAVDLIGIHGINPVDGTRAESVTKYLNQTQNRITSDGAPTDELIGAVGAVAGSRYRANGIGVDGGYAFDLATETFEDGRERNPELGFGTEVANWKGLSVATSSTVSGEPEAADTNLRALVGDFTQVQWGFQRRFPVEVIEYGDPDGNGDLKNLNQIAYRIEGVIYVAIFDLDAFAAVEAGGQ